MYNWLAKFLFLRSQMFALLVFLCAIAAAPSMADNQKDMLPVPPEVSRMVVWTQLCDALMTREYRAIDENTPSEALQKEIETTPALFWAQAHCDSESLEAEIVRLKETYKNDPVTSYALDHFLGAYKD